MANKYQQINIHIVFAVKHRQGLLSKEWRDELFRFMGGIVKKEGQVPLTIGGWKDHVHLLVGGSTKLDIGDLVKEIKTGTNKWINTYKTRGFEWQDGYGAFSISYSHIPAVKQYIADQENHHQNVSMLDEYKRILEKNGISYDDEYLPHEPC